MNVKSTETPFPFLAADDHGVAALRQVWEYLEPLPRVGDFFATCVGIKWHDDVRLFSEKPSTGFGPVLHAAKGTRQFRVARPVWLECHESALKGESVGLPWNAPKLIARVRLRGHEPWSIAAMSDTSGLICSRDHLALWPRDPADAASLAAFAAVLNGPVANALLAPLLPRQGVPIKALERIPVPAKLADDLSALVDEYVRELECDLLADRRNERLNALLMEVDAAVLSAYDLPARLENELLSYFSADGRPVAHEWQHWNAPDDAIAGLTLAERLSGRYDCAVSIGAVFAPLPADEAAALRAYWP